DLINRAPNHITLRVEKNIANELLDGKATGAWNAPVNRADHRADPTPVLCTLLRYFDVGGCANLGIWDCRLLHDFLCDLSAKGRVSGIHRAALGHDLYPDWQVELGNKAIERITIVGK